MDLTEGSETSAKRNLKMDLAEGSETSAKRNLKMDLTEGSETSAKHNEVCNVLVLLRCTSCRSTFYVLLDTDSCVALQLQLVMTSALNAAPY
jgi:hypothetical protein